MIDRTARIMANVACGMSLIALLAANTRAGADATTEPDAAALAAQVADLEARVATLEDQQDTTGCLAFSDFHYYRERVGSSGPKWRLPVMLWNMADPACRPTPAVWRPRHR